MVEPSITYYDRNAAKLVPRYDRLTFEDVHHGLLPYLPNPPAAILDVGAGSGRDAIALAHRGYLVTAVEPAKSMLRHGCERSADLAIEWINDRLPSLVSLQDRKASFDLILCSAVLMHIPPARLDLAIETMRGLLRPTGRLAVSVRTQAANDEPGLFNDHGAATIIGSADKAGLTLVRSFADEDRLGRAELIWNNFLFAREA